jgi:hypothetical protein
MKKIFSFLFAVVAALGLVACSGDLHDDVIVDPNAMSGNWFYCELDTSTATDDTISLIFNNAGGGKQTNDITGVAKTGTVAYVWVSGTKDYSVSTRTDCPDKGIGNTTDKLGVYVFTDSDVVSLWAWDSAVNLTGGTWPGAVMTTDATIVTDTVNVTMTFKVTGLADGDKAYINGTPWTWTGGWPFTDWNDGDADKTAACVANTDRWITAGADGTGTFASTVTKAVTKAEACDLELKVVTAVGDDPTAYTPGINYSSNGTCSFTPTADSSYLITIDVSDGSTYQCSAVKQ